MSSSSLNAISSGVVNVSRFSSIWLPRRLKIRRLTKSRLPSFSFLPMNILDSTLVSLIHARRNLENLYLPVLLS